MCGRCDPLRIPWGALRREHTQALRAKLAERYEPAGANTRLSALRGVLKEAWLLGQMDAELYHRAIEIKPVKGEKLPSGRHIRRRELQKLFNVCAKDERIAGRRDAAIIAVLYGGGLRRSEVVKLDRSDYDRDTGELRIRGGRDGGIVLPTRPTEPSTPSPSGWRCAATIQVRCSGRQRVEDGPTRTVE